jgi:hypothetical protein
VVVTDESLLGREDVAKFLEGAIFRPLHGGLARGDPSAVKVSTHVCALRYARIASVVMGPPRSEYIKVLQTQRWELWLSPVFSRALPLDR